MQRNWYPCWENFIACSLVLLLKTFDGFSPGVNQKGACFPPRQALFIFICSHNIESFEYRYLGPTL
jgi:hypothetical protein